MKKDTTYVNAIGAFDENGKLVCDNILANCETDMRIYRDTFDFGEALRLLKQGKKLTRDGWNGKGQFVYYVPAESYVAMTDAAKSIAAEDGKVSYRAYLALKTVQGDIAVWVPSVSDCLAEDWREVK